MNSTPSTPSGAPKNEGAPQPKRSRPIRDKLRAIMPWWAWILVLGLIAAVLASALAFAMMKSGQGKPGSSQSEPVGESRTYPAATTTGKYDKERETAPVQPPNSGYIPPAQPQVPVETAPTETSASEKKTTEKPKPQNNRGDGNRSQQRPDSRRPSVPNNSPNSPSTGNGNGRNNTGIGGTIGGNSGNGNSGRTNGGNTGGNTGAGDNAGTGNTRGNGQGNNGADEGN